MEEITHRFVEANGIRMHIAESGKGPLVILCHGFPEALPSWLTEKDVDYFASEFKRTGFRGGLNWYRNIDRNWELTSFLEGAQVYPPALFVAGEVDPVIKMYRKAYDSLEKNVLQLKKKILIRVWGTGSIKNGRLKSTN